jgi:hypothetical protein
MRIIFFMRNIGYIRNFEWALRRLADNQHEITVVIDRRKMESSEQAVYVHLDALTSRYSNIGFEELLRKARDSDLRVIATRYIRLAQDYLHYLNPEFADAPKLRQRCAHFLNPRFRWVVDRLGASRRFRRALSRFLRWLDDLIPAPEYISDFLAAKRPDLVLVTPLLDFGSHQPDYFKAARQLGIRSCLPVASWDNLTSKGLINIKPDRVLVWNELQKAEAVKFHGVPPGNVFVTGAHSYDHWFNWKPSSSREAFLSKVGLDERHHYILFLGSSRFIAPDEPPLVLKWAQALRGSDDPALRAIGILIRPHPQNGERWADVDVSSLGNAAVYPRLGANPVSSNAKAEYFDSMFHCRLVVGINTSAMIEAGILGKTVHTVLFEEAADTQEGTLHFHHLSADNGGLLHVSHNLPDHVAKVTAVLREGSQEAKRSKAFVDHFVRPPELKLPPTELVVQVLKDQLAEPVPSPTDAGPLTWLGRVMAAPLLLACLPEYLAGIQRRKQKQKDKNARKTALKHSVTQPRGGVK